MGKPQVATPEAHGPVTMAMVFGVPEDQAAAELVLSEESINGQLRRLVEVTMVDDLVQTHTIGDVRYRVSMGDEHFSDTPGLIDKAYEEHDGPQIQGFRLYQQVADRGESQDYHPVLLVLNGQLDTPVVKIYPASGRITKGGEIDFIEDYEQKDWLFRTIMAINADSRRHAHELTAAAKQDQSRRHKRIRAAIVGLAISAGVILGGPKAYDWVAEKWEKMEAENDARRAAEAAAEQRELERREAEVRAFDRARDIEDVSEFPAEVAAIATASTQFEDVNVPNLDNPDISEDLARNITEPREVALEFEDSSCMLIEDVDIREGDTGQFVHNGGQGRAYTVYMNPKDNTIEVCNSQVFDGSDLSEAEATDLVFQVERQPR